jgi:hypothetical protein
MSGPTVHFEDMRMHSRFGAGDRRTKETSRRPFGFEAARELLRTKARIWARAVTVKRIAEKVRGVHVAVPCLSTLKLWNLP